MKYRNLGKSPLKVSTLCLGTMMFGDQTDLHEARDIVAHAREHGVNFIDTADVYTTGKSETMVGELLKASRHDWVLATKVGNKMSERPNESHYSRGWVLRECDASLQRLGTDHIDIYYLHRDYDGMDLEEPLRALEALLRAGKIRYWGLSNFRGWRIAEAVHVARAHQHARSGGLPAVLQPAEPAARGRGAAGLRHLRHRRGALQPDRARRAVGQVRAGQQARRRHPRRARRQAHDGNRVPRGVAGDRADPEGALREARASRWPTSPPPGCWPTGT